MKFNLSCFYVKMIYFHCFIVFLAFSRIHPVGPSRFIDVALAHCGLGDDIFLGYRQLHEAVVEQFAHGSKLAFVFVLY